MSAYNLRFHGEIRKNVNTFSSWRNKKNINTFSLGKKKQKNSTLFLAMTCLDPQCLIKANDLKKEVHEGLEFVLIQNLIMIIFMHLQDLYLWIGILAIIPLVFVRMVIN